MKNNYFYKYLFFFLFFIFSNVNSAEEFNFDITEIEILENGNLYKGLKRGTITTTDGIILNADNFQYNKKLNILNAEGKVSIEDTVNNYLILTNKITYLRDKNIILTKEKSKAIDQNDNTIIDAQDFEYHKLENKIIANGNVIINNQIKNYKIFSNKITYLKNEEKFITDGKTRALIDSKYDIKSKNVLFFKDKSEISSQYETTILNDNIHLYNLSKFKYILGNKKLSGEKIIVTTNYNQPKSDKFYFKTAIIDLKNNNFIAGDTEIKVHKDIFSVKENDPRILGVSSNKSENLTTINKGIFTSCKKNDKCPPWAISAKRIQHDQNKKQISYDHAILKIYDKPVLYFPKFFHPDPTVFRQSGLLKPVINHSDILGSSLTMPYFLKIDEKRDFTIKPTWFDSDILMLQNEFRKIDNNSEILTDIGIVSGFHSKEANKKKNLNHFFAKFNKNLELENFISSDLFLTFEKTNNDSYLKVFDAHVTKSQVRPESFNSLRNELKIVLNHDNYNFSSGIKSYENLKTAKKSDRYQYILPYYNFDKVLSNKFLNGSLSFSSSGNNDLNNTNELKSNIINDFSYNSNSFISESGLSNNFNINLKNLNSVGKNYDQYKSSPQIEIVSIFSLNTSYPLIKSDEYYNSFLTPKTSLRFNPSDMKNNSTSNNKVDVGNIFNLNRLGFSDTHEAGRSLTLGLDYRKEKKIDLTDELLELDQINKYFEIRLATVLRDKEEHFIPKSSTINRKHSNIFGSVENSLSENLKINYNFALDNDFNKFEYNNFNTTILLGDLKTNISFIEESGEMGDNNIFENITEYSFNKFNSIKFKTRRNRKIDLTEYYDLVYEYKNDCLTAGVKYKKTYYEDRDLKPSENLLFTITLFPLTTYEYQADELVNN